MPIVGACWRTWLWGVVGGPQCSLFPFPWREAVAWRGPEPPDFPAFRHFPKRPWAGRGWEGGELTLGRAAT